MVLRISRLVTAATLLAAALLLSSCSLSDSPTGQNNQLTVQAVLKQADLGSSVTNVRLTITGDGIEDIVKDTVFVDGIATFEVEVPTGQDLTFTMMAMDIEGTVLYQGSEVTQIAPVGSATVNIKLEPQVPMIRVTPLYQQLTSTSETNQLRVEIHNVNALFGASFRIEFDSTIVKVGNVTEGSIFGQNQTIFFSRNEGNYVAVGLTIQGNQTQQGVDGGGIVATFDLLPGTASGTTDITINPDTIQLVDWQGNHLPAAGQLYIENGEVEAVAR